MDYRLDNVEDMKRLFYQFYFQPTADYELFDKARIFNSFRLNVGLDYTIVDDVKVSCVEMFVNVLMRDLLAFSDLIEGTDDYKVIRQFLLSVLKSRKTGVIWRFVSLDIRVRLEFLMTLDFRKCPIAKRFIYQMSDVYLQDTFIEKQEIKN